MKILRLSAWTVWFMLGWTALAFAEPVSGIIALVSGVLAKGGIAAALLKTAIGIGLNVAASLIQKAMGKKQAQPGITGQLQVGSNNSVSFVVGDYATAGSLEYTGEWGIPGQTPNAFHVQVISVSDLPQGGIKNRIWVNGQQCTIDFASSEQPGHPIVEYHRAPHNYMWAKVFDGSQIGADEYLMAAFANHSERPWQADMIGKGNTFVALTAHVNRELLTQLPSIRVEPVGLPLYDPRKDSSVGGAGAHRWGNPATYETTANPAVIIYNILRGIYYQGSLMFGPAISAPRMPLANWFAAMNECDVPIALASGGYEPQFRCGYEIKVAEHQPIDVIAELLKGCNGRMIETGGVLKIHVGAPGLPVAFISDEDFVVTEDQEFDPFPGLENTFNGASASYPEPEAGWEMKDAPQRLFPDLEAQDDNRQLLADFQFNAVPYATQVQRLMKSMVEDGRRFRKHRGTLPPFAFALEPMDIIAWTSPREGYIGKLFSIDSMDDLDNGNQAVAFREVDPADFDWNFSTDELPWSVGPLVPAWPVPVPMSGWYVVASAIKDEMGRDRRPAIDVYCDGDMEDVRAVQVQVRNGLDQIVFEGEQPYGERSEFQKVFRLSGQWCLPKAPYTVRGRYVPYGPQAADLSSWLYVLTLDIKLLPGVDFDLYEGVTGFDQLADDMAAYVDWIGDGRRDFEERLQEIDMRIANFALSGKGEFQEVRQQVTATYQHAKADYDRKITVIAGETEAIASSVETLTSELTDVETQLSGQATAISGMQTSITLQGGQISSLASQYVSLNSTVTTHTGQIAGQATAISGIQTNVTTLDGKVTATAQAITSISAASDPNNINTANWRMQVVAGPGGFTRIGAEGRAGGTGAWRSAGWYLDVPNNTAQPTRFAVQADQFVVTSSAASAGVNPLVWEAGILRIAGARMNWAQIDNVNINWAQIGTAVVNNFVAQTANIGDLTVDTIKIKSDAITSTWGASSGNVNLVSPGVWYTVVNVWVQVPTDAQLVETWFTARAGNNVAVRLVVDSTPVAGAYSVDMQQPSGSDPYAQVRLAWLTPAAGARPFSIQVRRPDFTVAEAVETPLIRVRVSRR